MVAGTRHSSGATPRDRPVPRPECVRARHARREGLRPSRDGPPELRAGRRLHSRPRAPPRDRGPTSCSSGDWSARRACRRCSRHSRPARTSTSSSRATEHWRNRLPGQPAASRTSCSSAASRPRRSARCTATPSRSLCHHSRSKCGASSRTRRWHKPRPSSPGTTEDLPRWSPSQAAASCTARTHELRAAVDRLMADPALRVELWAAGTRRGTGSVECRRAHVRYLEIVDECVEDQGETGAQHDHRTTAGRVGPVAGAHLPRHRRRTATAVDYCRAICRPPAQPSRRRLVEPLAARGDRRARATVAGPSAACSSPSMTGCGVSRSTPCRRSRAPT